MMNDKIDFLKNQLVPVLRSAPADLQRQWGVMSFQQMVEHFADAVKNASGKLRLPTINEGERLIKFRAFLMSEAPFAPNTKNPLVAEEGSPLRQPDLSYAIDKLQTEINSFFKVFETQPDLQTENPFFGSLSFEENIQLLHKHAIHHLKQFNLI